MNIRKSFDFIKNQKIQQRKRMKRKKIKMINLPPRDTTIPNQNQDNAQLNSDPLLNININTHKT